MLDDARCRRILREAFPEIAIRTLGYFASGWDYEMWEVNGELLVRFPRREECGKPLLKEVRLLAELADTISAPVPRPQFFSEGCEAFQLPFFGYRKLAGSPLSKVKLSARKRTSMARQLGRFLSELHRFPPDRAAALGVPTYSTEGWDQLYSELRETCDHNVSPLLSPAERDTVEAFWESFLGDDRNARFQPVLIHGDLGLDHILVDERRATITGVIDFGDAMVGDPALDFVGFDEALRQDVLSNYGLTSDETLLDRAAWYWQVGPFYEVLYGQQIGEPEYVESGLGGVRKRVILRS